MARLYLLRHGIALPHGTPDIPDDERPLTPKGEKRMREIGRGLRRLGVAPDAIITSPLPRAARTAEIVAEALKLTNLVEYHDALRPDRDAKSIREWLSSRLHFNLLLVGHNPAISELLRLLAAGEQSSFSCDLKKGGIAALRSTSEPVMSLEWVAQPRLFRRLAASTS